MSSRPETKPSRSESSPTMPGTTSACAAASAGGGTAATSVQRSNPAAGASQGLQNPPPLLPGPRARRCSSPAPVAHSVPRGRPWVAAEEPAAGRASSLAANVRAVRHVSAAARRPERPSALCRAASRPSERGTTPAHCAAALIAGAELIAACAAARCRRGAARMCGAGPIPHHSFRTHFNTPKLAFLGVERSIRRAAADRGGHRGVPSPHVDARVWAARSRRWSPTPG